MHSVPPNMADHAGTRRAFRLGVPARFNWGFNVCPYSYPREIEFVPDLPKTISGMLRRTELCALERERVRR